MSQRKKIMFIVPTLSNGGAERVVSIWASELAKMGVETHILLFYRVDDEYKINKNINLHVIEDNRTNYDSLSILYKLVKLRRKIKKNSPKVVIPFISHVGMMVALIRFGLNLKIIETIRNNPQTNPSSKLLRIIRNISMLFADKVIVQNDKQKQYFPRFLRKKIAVFYNPIDPSFLKYPKEYTKETIENMVAIGRLEKQKDYFNMIDAVETVVKNKPNMKLTIYGEGSMRAELDSYIEKKGLKNYIKINNRTNNVAKVLSENDLYIMSSQWEGMPNSLMEAMSISLPCISTDCDTGPSDLIFDGINGRLVPVGDSALLAKAIIEVAENVDSSIEMGKRARETIVKYHTSEQSAIELLEFMNKT